MKKLLWIILVFPLIANAAYQRNTARPVNDVVFGKVETVRYISQQDIVKAQGSGWETLLGAVVGGVIGNQFGDGRGKEVATAVGAIAGAGVARNHANQE
ncbi:glycine zipper 2TM domain-containing protein, partial [Vibrio sinaloensis]|uniref:glycine zipper 2TM domain-containing protein n=2 Tax=Vibrio TaxID=662 RepID=UPI002F40ED18